MEQVNDSYGVVVEVFEVCVLVIDVLVDLDAEHLYVRTFF